MQSDQSDGITERRQRLNDLVRALERAQRLGFLGSAPVAEHLEHARGFAVVDAPKHALDLGSGGGLPGLALAYQWPASRWVLLDAHERRAALLEQAVTELGLGDRVTVLRARAEVAAYDVRWRSRFDLIVARGFAAPAVTAECAAGFLQVSGLLVVSEPPAEGAERWPEGPLDELGLQDLGRRGGVRVLRQTRLVDASVPRRVGVPAKRPLW